MKRFILSPFASRDIDAVVQYLEQMPESLRTASGPRFSACWNRLANILYGVRDRAKSRAIMGFQVRSRLVASYRILYRMGNTVPEILGIIHTSRDIPAVMAKRVQ